MSLSLSLSLAYNSLSGTLNILSQIQLSHHHINTFLSLSLSIPSLSFSLKNTSKQRWKHLVVGVLVMRSYRHFPTWWVLLACESVPGKTATTEVQPHQFNATPTSSGKRLNRCYQFNATVLVLFFLWDPIILMQKIYINGSSPPPKGIFLSKWKM